MFGLCYDEGKFLYVLCGVYQLFLWVWEIICWECTVKVLYAFGRNFFCNLWPWFVEFAFSWHPQILPILSVIVSFKSLLLEAIIVEFIFGRMMMVKFFMCLILIHRFWFHQWGTLWPSKVRSNILVTPLGSPAEIRVNVDPDPGCSFGVLDHKRWFQSS